MYKGLVADVAKEVGKSAALILNQLYQWFKSQKVEKVYRTNEELKADLHNLVSTATIQRAKQRLVKEGYIVVSFDKGLNRTTHYLLTDKAKKMLAPVVEKPQTQPAPNKKSSGSKPFSKQNSVGKADDHLPETVKRLFEEAGKEREGIVKGVPEALKKLIGIKGKKKDSIPEQPVKGAQDLPPLPPVVADEEFFGVSAFEDNEPSEDMSDEEWFGVTPEQWIAIDIANGQTQAPEKKLSMGELMGMAFNSVPNVEIRESNRALLEAAQNYKEEW